jgi:hypothetical protein
MVRYNVKKSLVAGTRREDLIMRHVVAARLEISRRVVLGGLLALVGVSWLFGGLGSGSGAAIFALVPIAIGVLFLWGTPRVAVTASDGLARPSVSWPWTRDEAEAFVNAVSRELLARG